LIVVRKSPRLHNEEGRREFPQRASREALRRRCAKLYSWFFTIELQFLTVVSLEAMCGIVRRLVLTLVLVASASTRRSSRYLRTVEVTGALYKDRAF
jgi:hypothetical protein